MDQAAIEANGLAPGAGGSEAHRRGQEPRTDIARLFGTVGFASLFDVQLPPDFKNPDRYSVVHQRVRLGLPDRDYYLKDDPHAEGAAREVRGLRRADADPGRQRRIRTPRRATSWRSRPRWRKVQWPIEKRRDVDAIYNPRTKAQLVAYAPGFPWQELPGGAGSSAPARTWCWRADRHQGAGRALQPHAAADPQGVPDLPLPERQCRRTCRKRFDQARFAFYGQTHARPAAAARALEARRGCGGRRDRRVGRPALRGGSISRPNPRPRCSSWWPTCAPRSASASMRSTG